jgi:hypothetical protein
MLIAFHPRPANIGALVSVAGNLSYKDFVKRRCITVGSGSVSINQYPRNGKREGCQERPIYMEKAKARSVPEKQNLFANRIYGLLRE